VVRLLPPENIKIRFFVPEPLIGSIRCGQGILIRIDGVTNEIAAAITYVAAEPEYTPPIIYSNETRAKLVFMIEARPDPARAASLHPGQPVTVRFP
jgi:HlyD family secretion protein